MLANWRQRFWDFAMGTSPARRLKILRVLADGGPKYGYRIVEQFDGKLDHGTLHAEMSQLKANGHVTESPPDFRYTITDAGRALLAASELTPNGEGDAGAL